MSCFGHALLFLTSHRLLADCTGLSPVQVKIFLHPPSSSHAMDRGKSGQKEVLEKPHVSEWAWCVWETLVRERGWGWPSVAAWQLDQAGQVHPTLRHQRAAERASALLWVQGNGDLPEAAAGGAGRESKRASHLEQDLLGQWQRQ